ncbi:Hydroxysteroid dehydrogenase-like protein 2 [Sarcoptes scabiei]|uniref:Hydroxysteroid dehydrogenase-like protein 2 n=1 Tax=Sarcoptes scabiei TaxID=52283 RepID=A0A834VFF6_SARSC|nr:Hydroxysteroid dehydrogenase-like protein 2 [Sarcoptes scabiei]
MLKNTGAFLGKTIFVTGASRGIGKAIIMKMAKDGANVVIAAKTTEKHSKLEGTIFTAAKEVEDVGGKALPVKCDIRDEENVISAVNEAVKKFGAIDIVINNASAISLTTTEDTTMKKYDLMNQINTRGTYMTSKYCIEHLKKSSNPHILTLSPPLEMKPHWFGRHLAYTISKYGMSLCVLGLSDELKEFGIGVNALWPRTAIWTAAMNMLGGGQSEMANLCRNVDIMADSAYAILSKDSKTCTGNFFIDEEVLRNEGITDFSPYAIKQGSELLADFFIPEYLMKGLTVNFDQNPESSTSSASTSNDNDVAKVFEKIPSLLNDQMRKDLNASLVFVVSDRIFIIDTNSPEMLKLDVKEMPPHSDVTMITDNETFIKMSSGKLKSTNAFMAGKLKIKGNLSLAMKVGKIFDALQKM